MRLIEIVEGDETSPETLQRRDQLRPGDPQAADRAARDVPGLRRQPHPELSGCRRSAAHQEERGLSIKKIDEGVGAKNVAPMGPFFLIDLLGLDTVLHVGEHLLESYGRALLRPRGHAGSSSPTAGSARRPAAPASTRTASRRSRATRTPTPTSWPSSSSSRRWSRRAWCSRSGVAQTRAIDLGLMAGAGLDPRRGILPPLLRADVEGLDATLERLESAEERYGDRFAAAGGPPAPRRAGPPRPEVRPGLLPVAAPRRGLRRRSGAARDARRRGDRVARTTRRPTRCRRRSSRRSAARGST